MIKSHEARIELGTAAQERRAARDAGTERDRRMRRAKRLASKVRYGKAAKALAQHDTLDPSSLQVPEKLHAVHPAPSEPVNVIRLKIFAEACD